MSGFRNGTTAANDKFSDWKDFPIGLRVLLFDEDGDFVRDIQAKLEAHGYIVRAFTSGNDALEAIRDGGGEGEEQRTKFHVALVEAISSTEGMNCFTLLNSAKDMPVILMSTFDNLNLVMLGIAAGAVDFLQKPLTDKQIRNIWQHVVRKAIDLGDTSVMRFIAPGKTAPFASPARILPPPPSSPLLREKQLSMAVAENADNDSKQPRVTIEKRPGCNSGSDGKAKTSSSQGERRYVETAPEEMRSVDNVHQEMHCVQTADRELVVVDATAGQSMPKDEKIENEEDGRVHMGDIFAGPTSIGHLFDNVYLRGNFEMSAVLPTSPADSDSSMGMFAHADMDGVKTQLFEARRKGKKNAMLQPPELEAHGGFLETDDGGSSILTKATRKGDDMHMGRRNESRKESLGEGRNGGHSHSLGEASEVNEPKITFDCDESSMASAVVGRLREKKREFSTQDMCSDLSCGSSCGGDVQGMHPIENGEGIFVRGDRSTENSDTTGAAVLTEPFLCRGTAAAVDDPERGSPIERGSESREANETCDVSGRDLDGGKVSGGGIKGSGLGSGRRKVKVDWTADLHRRFVQAVDQLGVDKAIPSRILELMGVECLTRHNIASHLQKYRSHLRHLAAREAEAASWQHRRPVIDPNMWAARQRWDGTSWVFVPQNQPPIQPRPSAPPPTQRLPHPLTSAMSVMQSVPTHHAVAAAMPRIDHHSTGAPPLHAWGHPTIDHSAVHMWVQPRTIASPATWNAPDRSIWHHPAALMNAWGHPIAAPAPGTPCYPQPTSTLQTIPSQQPTPPTSTTMACQNGHASLRAVKSGRKPGEGVTTSSLHPRTVSYGQAAGRCCSVDAPASARETDASTYVASIMGLKTASSLSADSFFALDDTVAILPEIDCDGDSIIARDSIIDGSVSNESSAALQVQQELVDAAIREALSNPWTPLPLGLRPPSMDGVLSELRKRKAVTSDGKWTF